MYTPNEEWTLLVDSDESEVAGMIKYHLDEDNAVFVETDYELDEFEVQKGGDEGRVIEYTDLAAGVGVEHIFNEHVTGTISAGGVFNRKIEYLDGNGKVNIEVSPYVGIDLTGTF